MLTPDRISDLVISTQNKLISRGAFLNLMTDLTDYVAVREMYKKHQKVFNGGLDWEFEAVLDHNHSARFTSLYDDDGASVNDGIIKGTVGPRFVDANYVFDIREKVFQQGPEVIIDYVKTKYTKMIVSFWELLEPALWGKPEDSTDKTTPYGVEFWVTKGTPVANDRGEFCGGNPAGFSDGRAGIDSNKYKRWRNWSAKYAAITNDDLVDKMLRAHRMTMFRSPVSIKEPSLGGTGNGIYTNDAVITDFTKIIRAQNMNLGNELGSKDGEAMFKGSPIVYAPYLDDDTHNPVYMLDWKWLALGMLAGWEEHTSAPQPVAGKHNVRAVFLDGGLNMICTNLRRQTVLWKE